MKPPPPNLGPSNSVAALREPAVPPVGNPDRVNLRSILMSMVVHSLLVLLLLFFVTGPQAGGDGTLIRPAGIVLTERSENSEDRYLDQEQLEQQTTAQSAATALAAASDAAPPIETDTPKLEIEAPGLDTSALNANAMTTGVGQGRKPSEELSAADLALIEADQALVLSRQPAGPATSISIFGGGQMTGRSFLFLLDRSKSMGAGGLGVIQAARGELSAAINQLEEHHQFQVIGYHQQTVAMDMKQMLPANQQNQSRVAGYIAKLAAFGATDHYNALQVAATFKPDVIVLLTDGGPPELNAAQLKTIHKMAAGAQIHCLVFGFGKQQRAPAFLTELAQQNAGTYRYIDVQEWD